MNTQHPERVRPTNPPTAPWPTIRSFDQNADYVYAVWDDGHASTFHYVWLRDNCRCEKCVHPKTMEVSFDTATIPGNIKPSRVDVTAQGGLDLVWETDQHRSAFDPRWLRAHCYSDPKLAPHVAPSPPLGWNPNLTAVLQRASYAEVMADDAAHLRWLRGLRDYGVSVMHGVPAEPGAVLSITNRVAFTRPTNFGTTFDIKNIPSPNSSAYTSLGLALHTDLAYHDRPPSFQFFHCIESSARGGESLVADGFAVAEALRAEDKAAFDILTRVPVDFRFHDDNVDYRYSGPTIVLDARGELEEIRHAPTVTEPFRAAAHEMVEMRRAYQKLVELTRQPRFCEQLLLKPGEMLVTDNRRVMHGRTAFDPSSGTRFLQGCYVDRADLVSRIRVLERTR